MSTFTLPTRLRFIDQDQCRTELFIRTTGRKTALFLTETQAESLGLLSVIEKISLAGDLTWIKAIPTKLTVTDLKTTLKLLKSPAYELFIAIGHAGALDLAKLCAALLPTVSADPDLQTLEHLKPRSLDKAPTLIAISTSGSYGSELLPWATVLDFKRQTAVKVDACRAFDEAWIVIDYYRRDPLALTLSGGLCALAQASEAYWAEAATDAIRRLALQSIRLIVKTLPKVLAEPQESSSRRQLVFGSLLAAMADCNVTSGAGFAIAEALILTTEMDLGLAFALTLPDLLRLNLSTLTNPEGLYDAFNIENPQALRYNLEKYAQGIASLRLSDAGITESALDQLAAVAMAQPAFANNPTLLIRDHVIAILKLHL